MDSQNINVLRPVLIDAVSFLLLGVFNFYVAQIAVPFRRGFFCDDETIRYPFHDSTVPALWLNICGVAIPIIMILFFELIDAKENKKSNPTYKLGSLKLKWYYWNVYKMIICYGCGAIFCQLLTDLGKKTIGRLRPHFIDVCKPTNLASLCSSSSNSAFLYIENYTCETDDSIVNESRVSFPSGHASFSFYVAVFIVLYLGKKMKTKSTLLKPIIQFFFLLMAWFTSLSRVMNNKHHWSDVTAGIILGSGTAIVNTVIVHRLFDANKNQDTIDGNRSNNVVDEAHNQL